MVNPGLVPATVIDEARKSFGLSYSKTFLDYPLREHDINAIPVLIRLLKDKNPTVRMYAAETFGGMGSCAILSTPALLCLLNDREIGGFGISVRDRAIESLLHIASSLFREPDRLRGSWVK